MSQIIDRIRTMLQQPKPITITGLTSLVLAALEAGAAIAKQEMRYHAKSQRLGEVRRANFDLRAKNTKLILEQTVLKKQRDAALAELAGLEKRVTDLEEQRAIATAPEPNHASAE